MSVGSDHRAHKLNREAKAVSGGSDHRAYKINREVICSCFKQNIHIHDKIATMHGQTFFPAPTIWCSLPIHLCVPSWRHGPKVYQNGTEWASQEATKRFKNQQDVVNKNQICLLARTGCFLRSWRSPFKTFWSGLHLVVFLDLPIPLGFQVQKWLWWRVGMSF